MCEGSLSSQWFSSGRLLIQWCRNSSYRKLRWACEDMVCQNRQLLSSSSRTYGHCHICLFCSWRSARGDRIFWWLCQSMALCLWSLWDDTVDTLRFGTNPQSCRLSGWRPGLDRLPWWSLPAMGTFHRVHVPSLWSRGSCALCCHLPGWLPHLMWWCRWFLQILEPENSQVQASLSPKRRTNLKCDAS